MKTIVERSGNVLGTAAEYTGRQRLKKLGQTRQHREQWTMTVLLIALVAVALTATYVVQAGAGRERRMR